MFLGKGGEWMLLRCVRADCYAHAFSSGVERSGEVPLSLSEYQSDVMLILINLCFQLLNAAESFLVPYVLNEPNLNAFAVDIAVEVEQMYFDASLPIVECGSASYV